MLFSILKDVLFWSPLVLVGLPAYGFGFSALVGDLVGYLKGR